MIVPRCTKRDELSHAQIMRCARQVMNFVRHVILTSVGRCRTTTFGAHRDSPIQVGDVVVHEPEAARRYGAADGLRLVGAVDAVDRGAEIERARAHRIARTARHEARQIRLALDHLRRRRPVGPFRLPGDLEQSLPLEAFAADADAVADRPVVSLNEVEIAIGGIDDDRPRRLVGPVEDRLPLIRRRQSLVARIRHDAGLIVDRHRSTRLRIDTIGIRRPGRASTPDGD